MNILKKLSRLINQIFCLHKYRYTVAFSKKRQKYVDQCMKCKKYFYTDSI